jgi:DNA mismatch repair protein MutS
MPPAKAQPDESTPIRRQYLDLKRQHIGSILFFRLGDFYETFDADAELVSRELDVVLTSRPVGKDTRVPMAGVPHHAAEGYIARLIERGYRVAIAEQLGSEPVNGLVPREVRRVITPGTVVEPGMLEARRPNYLAAVIQTATAAGLAYCDITIGEFSAAQLDSAVELERELARVQPRELLAERKDDSFTPDTDAHAAWRFPVTAYPSYRFEVSNARNALIDHFQTATLQGFGLEERPLALRAAGAIVQYLRETQPAALKQLTELRTFSTAHFMGLDPVTRRNLELTEPMRGREGPGRAATLLGVLDQTRTPMGARLLRTWVAQPLREHSAIEDRLAWVDAFAGDALGRTVCRDGLKDMPDLERLTARVISGIATPQDLLKLKLACQLIRDLRVPEHPALSLAYKTPDLEPVIRLIAQAIKHEPDDDGFIAPGYSEELDGIHLAARDAKNWVANLERVERERTGIRSLKVGYNKVFGYYLEITHSNTKDVPDDYIRKQTLANAERYITPQLKEYETLILNADERIGEIERRLLIEVLQALAVQARPLLDAARLIARLDVAAGLAEVAARNNYARPVFNTDNRLQIVDGRHPVIERLLSDKPYTPNDCRIDGAARVHVITGPNMSGKSSYMRQVALIVLMAQIGSYVPAVSADICPVDRIFTRIGAQDELTSGQSTFMVEMVETAAILHHCTPRSLVILDEIGRGTSTYDGLAIAWSVIEFLHNHPERRAMTLFATHYHELIQLAGTLPHVRNWNVAVSDEGGRVVFLHTVVEGGADRSYGIHVAQLAGLPPAVIHRAQDVLRQLEAGRTGDVSIGSSAAPVEAPTQMSLFTAESPALDKLRTLDPNTLSPIEALTALFELKKLAG